VAAQLDDACLEREPCAGRGPLEDQRDHVAGERRRRPGCRLELEGPVEQRLELAGLKLGTREEVVGHGSGGG
jgi:hypothetical protein